MKRVNMKSLFIPLTVITILFSTACSTSKQTVIPLNHSLELNDTYTIIWNGISKAYRYENEQWIREDSYDYQFDVVQRRYNNQWKSVKSLHRIHPEYDGKAGDRDQTMYFEIAYKSLTESKVQAVINSSLGTGNGTTDTEFRKSVLTMYVQNPSRFLPYNKFRISQHYNYEEGILTETVELLKEKDGIEIPFMKNEETAHIFIKSKLNKAPTSFQH